MLGNETRGHVTRHYIVLPWHHFVHLILALNFFFLLTLSTGKKCLFMTEKSTFFFWKNKVFRILWKVETSYFYDFEFFHFFIVFPALYILHTLYMILIIIYNVSIYRALIYYTVQRDILHSAAWYITQCSVIYYTVQRDITQCNTILQYR